MMLTRPPLLCSILSALFFTSALALPSDADCMSAYHSMGQNTMWVRL